MPRVSILMPVRDGESTLPAALRSIFGQTYRDWELIVVDDGSRTPVHVGGAIVRRTEPRGIVAALQLAASLAGGEFLARMDADDVMRRDRLERQVSAMDVDVLATRVSVPRSPGMAAYVRWQNRQLTHEEITHSLFVESPIAHSSVMMRRAAFERAGGYRESAWAEDYDLWHRMAAAGARFAKLPRVLLRWTDRPERLTRTHPMYSDRAFYEAKKHYLLPRLGAPVMIWGAGPIGRRWARDLLAAGAGVDGAIDIDPRKIGRTICVNRVRVYSPEEGLRRRRGLVLGAVGSRGARDLIRPRLLSAGLREGVDFLFVA